jgi:hypothetical protein
MAQQVAFQAGSPLQAIAGTNMKTFCASSEKNPDIWAYAPYWGGLEGIVSGVCRLKNKCRH